MNGGFFWRVVQAPDGWADAKQRQLCWVQNHTWHRLVWVSWAGEKTETAAEPCPPLRNPVSTSVFHLKFVDQMWRTAMFIVVANALLLGGLLLL